MQGKFQRNTPLRGNPVFVYAVEIELEAHNVAVSVVINARSLASVTVRCHAEYIQFNAGIAHLTYHTLYIAHSEEGQKGINRVGRNLNSHSALGKIDVHRRIDGTCGSVFGIEIEYGLFSFFCREYVRHGSGDYGLGNRTAVGNVITYGISVLPDKLFYVIESVLDVQTLNVEPGSVHVNEIDFLSFFVEHRPEYQLQYHIFRRIVFSVVVEREQSKRNIGIGKVPVEQREQIDTGFQRQTEIASYLA